MKTPGLWIDLNRLERETFRNQNNKPLLFTNWDRDQPKSQQVQPLGLRGILQYKVLTSIIKIASLENYTSFCYRNLNYSAGCLNAIFFFIYAKKTRRHQVFYVNYILQQIHVSCILKHVILFVKGRLCSDVYRHLRQ